MYRHMITYRYIHLFLNPIYFFYRKNSGEFYLANFERYIWHLNEKTFIQYLSLYILIYVPTHRTGFTPFSSAYLTAIVLTLKRSLRTL